MSNTYYDFYDGEHKEPTVRYNNHAEVTLVDRAFIKKVSGVRSIYALSMRDINEFFQDIIDWENASHKGERNDGR